MDIYEGIHSDIHSTLPIKKYVEILLHYRWLFIKGGVFIGEWGIFWCRGFPSL